MAQMAQCTNQTFRRSQKIPNDMRDLTEIVKEVNDSKLRSLLTTSEIVQVALQIQRNEILEECLGGDSIFSSIGAIEQLTSEMVDLNRNLSKLSETLYNKE